MSNEGRVAVPKTMYRAVAERGPEAWHVTLPDLGLTATSRRIDQIEEAAAEAICYSDGIDIDWGFGIAVEMANPYVPVPGTPSAVVCDIDGTLALHNSRGPFEMEKVETDDVNPPVELFLKLMFSRFSEVVLLSGRQSEYRLHTERWLEKHKIPYNELHMRTFGDSRSDDLVKAELFDTSVRDRFTVTHVLDDRDRCVYLWRKLGLPCWQVNFGKF